MNKQAKTISKKPQSTIIHMLGGRYVMASETMHIDKLNVGLHRPLGR